jgi:hypothetical protein
MPRDEAAASPISSISVGIASKTAPNVPRTRSTHPVDSRYQSTRQPASSSNGA